MGLGDPVAEAGCCILGSEGLSSKFGSSSYELLTLDKSVSLL